MRERVVNIIETFVEIILFFSFQDVREHINDVIVNIIDYG